MEAKIRFGVRADDGRTSNVWICWTNPEKGDVYLTSDVLGKALKLSDHPTGRSHIAYHYEKRDELFTQETVPKERFVLKQEDAGRIDEVCRLVACVSFPSGSPHDVPRQAPADTVWLPEAPQGQATEVGVFRFNVFPLSNTWPGKREGTNFLGSLPLADAGCLYLVWRHSLFTMPATPTTAGKNGLFRGRNEEDLLDANRAVLFGTTADGAISLIETRVSISRKDKSGP